MVLGESLGHGAAEESGAADGHERDHAAAEAAARHAGPGRACADGRLDRLVSLRPRHLELVAERAVRGGQQGADRGLVASPEQFGRLQHAAVLGDDVPAHPGQGRVGQLGQVLSCDVSQRPHAQRGRGLLAGPPALRVAAIPERAPGPGVDDQQRQAGRGRVERDRRPGARAAVEQQRVAGAR